MRLLPCCLLTWFAFVATLTSNSLAAQSKADHRIRVSDLESAEADVCVGPSQQIAIVFTFADGKSQKLDGKVRGDELRRTVESDGKKATESTPMPDALVEFRGAELVIRCHSRPCLARYTEAQRADLAKTWTSLPAASGRPIHFETRPDAHGVQLWLDGRYCGVIPSERPLTEIVFKLGDGGAVRDARTYRRTDTGLYLPLDVRHIARPNAMKDAVVSLKPGLQAVHRVPIIAVRGSDNADVGVVKEMQGSRFLETDENLSRTSLDGMPQSLHFSVPQQFYYRAWVLCAAEPDPRKDPVLTARITRFAGSGRGGAIVDTSIALPRGDESPASGLTSVGTVRYTAGDGKRLSVPLVLAKMDLGIGEILDLLADRQDRFAPMKIGPYLDFEFLGKRDGIYAQSDRRHKPLRGSTSAVHVFGVTLEQCPVELRLEQAQPGNIFHNDEKPETTARVRANLVGRYTLQWSFTDVAGTVLKTERKSLDMPTVGGEASVTIPLAMPALGWYGLRFSVLDSSGRELLCHDAAMALLGQDTRVAGYESPYGTWWFGGAHYTCADPKRIGPMLFKAGLRRTVFGWTRDSEAEFAPWKVSLNQVGWQFRLKDLDNFEEAKARVEKKVSELVARFPHCRYVDIFHESYPNTLPSEVYGEKPVLDAKQKETDENFHKLGLMAARFFREKFPQLKLVFGNSGGSASSVAMLLRQKFPREYIDYLGSETTGQTIAPEKLSIHTTMGIWLLRETARKFGQDIPLTGCFEFTSRCERDLGAERQAEWYTRDVLIPLAYRFPTISPAGLEDVSNAYYNTLWGAGGLCQRNPLHYPKPAYVAIATLTKVLDSVRLLRQMPTGSSSAFVLEFARGNERVYALWTPRGNCEMTFEFPADTTVSRIEFHGKRTTLETRGRKLNVQAGSAASYIVCPVGAVAATAGRRTFPAHQAPAGTTVASHMDNAAQWELSTDTRVLTNTLQRPGNFAMRQVDDPEKGACIELELKHQGEVPDLVGEYVELRLKQPAPMAGKPHTVGVWVKGNSSWGRVFWELEDAKGRVLRSTAGYDGGDWGNQAAIDFDGWCFVTFPLTDESPARHVEPGLGAGQWARVGAGGPIEYPVKLRALYVLMYRKSVNLTEMTPVRGNIRLKDVSAIQ